MGAVVAKAKQAIEIRGVTAGNWSKGLESAQKRWADAHGFKGDAGKHLSLPSPAGGIAAVLWGVDSAADPFSPAKLARALPAGSYRFGSAMPNPRLAALGWALEAYDFRKPVHEVRLECPAGIDLDELERAEAATRLVRDLVNRPANDLGPDELEAAARSVAKSKVSVTRGKALERGFPLIHAVGQASPRAPRLVDFSWGARGPKVAIVGKGVCFDTGGLDIKPASGMALMKKDMGGAATALGLAKMIMAAKLPVRLRVLIPIVENAIAGNAFRPGDVFRSRKGLTVEIGNTDAEGRLILADALALADDDKPDIMISLATLTGAARVALGPDLPPFYTDDDKLADAISRHGMAENDPVWRMPLWKSYNRMFESPVADLNNSSDSGFAGSITTALFLKRFVEKAASYVHFDIFAWTPVAKPGRPKGGEAQAMRALFAVLKERYAG